MMSVWHLVWIIPLTIFLTFFAFILVSASKLNENYDNEENKNDNQNA